MAREFWTEVHDLRAPVDDLRDKRGAAKPRRKKIRVLLTRRPTRAA